MLRDQQGIHSIKVALLAERGVVEYDPSVWTPEKLINVGTTYFNCITVIPRMTGNIRHRFRCNPNSTNSCRYGNPKDIWHDMLVMYLHS